MPSRIPRRRTPLAGRSLRDGKPTDSRDHAILCSLLLSLGVTPEKTAMAPTLNEQHNGGEGDLRPHMLDMLGLIREAMNRTDNRAAILLGISGGLLAAVVALLSAGAEAQLFQPGTVAFTAVVIGAAAIMAAVLMFVIAVMPRFKSGPAGWKQLTRLKTEDEVIGAIGRSYNDTRAQARQIIRMSKIVAGKWWQVQLGTAFLTGGLLITFCAVITRMLTRS